MDMLSDTTPATEATLAFCAAGMLVLPLPLVVRLLGLVLLVCGTALHLGRAIKRLPRSADENYGNDPSQETFFHLVYSGLWLTMLVAAGLYLLARAALP